MRLNRVVIGSFVLALAAACQLSSPAEDEDVPMVMDAGVDPDAGVDDGGDAAVDAGADPDADAGADPDAGMDADAGADAGPDGGEVPTDPFRGALLTEHNAVRAGASPTPDPALAPLAWSTSVESVAQAWANNCQWGHNPDRGAVGENIYATTSASATPATVVQAWASEAPFYDYASNTCASGKICGHYTQLVWRTTTELGCAKQTCNTGSPFGGSGIWYFWVCDYAPPGNVMGQRPY